LIVVVTLFFGVRLGTMAIGNQAAGWLPAVRNMYPYPNQRFAATLSR
jgi:hypothetical protein